MYGMSFICDNKCWWLGHWDEPLLPLSCSVLLSVHIVLTFLKV